MEICYLNYEISKIEGDSISKGKTIYDPLENVLLFYDGEENIIYSKKIESLNLIPHYLKENKLAFKDEENNLVSIKCDVKEFLELKSFRYVLSKIVTNQDKQKFIDKRVNESKYIISKAKEYQLEILESAKEKNTIVFLETGLGKTYISILLIKHLFGEPVESNSLNILEYKKSTNKKVIFLFKTISLLLQQSKVLRSNTNLRILKFYGGQEGNNAPSYQKFRKIIEKYDIICATPEIIYRYFTFGYITAEDLILIVLDECHHTKDKDYYNLILKHFIHPVTEEIKILGLTASPSFDSEKSEEKIAENIQILCNNMNSYLTCPSNILSSDNSDKYSMNINLEKEISFILLDINSNNIENDVKLMIYNNIMLPFIINYIKLRQSNSFNFTNESFETIFFSSLLFTLFADEYKISEKLNGIFDKSDCDILTKFLSQTSVDGETSNNYITIFKSFFEKFKTESERCDIEKMNFSREMKEFEKKTNDDPIIKYFKRLAKNINYIFKYADLESFYEHTSNFFQEIKLFYSHLFNKAEFVDIINESLNQVEQLKKFNNFKSNYLCALEKFIGGIINNIDADENAKSSSFDIPKSIIFVNQRLVAKILNDKLNQFLIKTRYSCKYVVGCQNQSAVPFSEEELKHNIEIFSSQPNCLVLFATNVLEEGIDVPQCNNVINLTEIRTIKEFIQKSGRARKSDSTMYLCCYSKDQNEYKNKIDQIKISIKVMKKIISDNKLQPKIKSDKILAGLNYYQTNAGARVYLSYAKKMVEEFICKLFFDGYTFLRSSFKTEEISDLKTGKKSYRPYLSLPYVLESNFSRIFDNEEVSFESQEEAKRYFSRYEEFYYLKAVRLLHMNHYLNDHLLFTKNYDDLMNIENNCSKFEAEPKIRLIKENTNEKHDCWHDKDINNKKNNLTDIKLDPNSVDETIELVAHLLEISPNYIDINFNFSQNNSQAQAKPKLIAIIADSPLTLVNFDLYIQSTQLIKLYHFNTFDEERKSPEFSNKPKIPYNVFTKLNITMEKYQSIKLNKNDLKLINFLYTYILYSSTDAELFFFYCLHKKKFDFAESLFLNDKKIASKLEFIFENFSKSLSEAKQHLNDFNNANLGYGDHMIKITLVNQFIKNDGEKCLAFDLEYMSYVVKCVKDDIDFYYNFIVDCVNNEDDVKMMVWDRKYIEDKESELVKKRKNFELPNCGIICRNMVNYGKLFILNYGQTDLRGTTIYNKGDSIANRNKHHNQTKYDNQIKKEKIDYQTHFLIKYGVLTDRYRDYKKCLPLDYNQKVLKYKVNLNQVGKVNRSFHKVHYLKKFHFLPNEVIQEIKFASIDQLYLFTLFPVILYKTQNSLVYYYQAYCLRNSFKSFGSLEQIDIRLLTQSLNSRSTLECENYERLEFLGDSVLKFLSSLEVFNQYPEANRDLLYSKRKVIESNKTLFNIAVDEKNKMDRYLFTSPVTIKRINIPGFDKDESLMFNIGYNRSFAKSCFFKLQAEKKTDEDMDLGILKKGFRDFYNIHDKKDADEIKDEEKSEKTMINIQYEDNIDPIYKNEEVLVDDKLIDHVVNNKIEIIPSKSFRIIFHKVLADLVESLTGYLLHASIYSLYKNLSSMFDKSSLFLKELGVLKYEFKEMLNVNNKFWLENLISKKCRFSENQKYMRVRPIAENKRYNFKNIELLYQACTHCSYLSEESIKFEFPYVRKSYQRLAFIGEAFVSFYVSLWVYNTSRDANEGLLHKLKICGINHHIISMIAIDLKLDDCLLKNEKDIDEDLRIYKNKFLEVRSQSENIYKIMNENILDDNFIIILCELFHAYIGAILLDSCDILETFLILKDIMDVYLENNATKKNYTQHPKVIILDEFYRRRNYFKNIRENGSNRVNFRNDKSEKFRRLKMYKYQLIIDKFIIYEEFIYYNRSTIKIAQEKAKEVFLKICKEIDKREKLGLHHKFFDLENIIINLGIAYEKQVIEKIRMKFITFLLLFLTFRPTIDISKLLVVIFYHCMSILNLLTFKRSAYIVSSEEKSKKAHLKIIFIYLIVGILDYNFYKLINFPIDTKDFSSLTSKGVPTNFDSLIYYIFSCEFVFLLIKLIAKLIKLLIDLTQINIRKHWNLKLTVFNVISFIRYSIKLAIEIKFCIVLIKVGVVPIFFIIDVFYSCWNLFKLGYKLFDNYRTNKYINNLANYNAPVQNKVDEKEEEKDQGELQEKERNKIVDKNNEVICNICLDDIKTGKMLNCGHIFHLRCIKEWVTTNSGCPLCKLPISSESKPHKRFLQNNANQNGIEFEDAQSDADNSKHLTTSDNKLLTFSKSNSDIKKLKNYTNILNVINKIENNRQTEEVETGAVSFALPCQAIYNRSVKNEIKRLEFEIYNKKLLEIYENPGQALSLYEEDIKKIKNFLSLN